MREGPLETLDRHRGTFLKSLLDGIGKFDAGAEFYFSAINAERSGYVLSPHDESLLKMFNSVIRKADEQQITGPSASYDLNQGTADEDMTGSAGFQQSQMSYVMGHGAGMNLSPNPSYQEQRIISPEPGQTLSGRQFEMRDGHEDDPYRTHNFLGSDMNPLHGNTHDIVGDFYVHPDDPYAESQSQKDHHKEDKWEQFIKDNPEYDFLHNKFHYGPLDTNHSTNHKFYEHDYLNWSTNNASEIDKLRLSLEEQGLDENQIEHELRKAHINEKKAEWKENLGMMDYFFGMEWLTPEQRHDAYEHMKKNGANHKEAFRTNTHNGNPNWMPRFIRNFHQRFSGLYDHWVKHAPTPGNGMQIKPIALPDHAGQPSPEMNWDTMRGHNSPGKVNSWERAVKHYNEIARDYHILNDSENKYRPLLQTQTLRITNRLDEFGQTRRELEVVPLKQYDEKGYLKEYYPGYEVMKFMLGIDDDHQLYPKGEHPVWGRAWDGPEFTQDEIDTIFQRRADEAKRLAGIGRMGRNHGPMNYGFAMDPNDYDYLDDHETAATHWHLPFAGRGGLGKHPNELFNLIHHHTLSYKEDEKKPSDSFDASAFYPGFALPEEEKESQEAEYEPDTENITGTFGADRQNSLLFSRNKSGIEGRHDYDASGKVTDYGMLPFLAPFGQAENQMFEMKEGQKTIRTNVKGDPLDAATNLNPHNVMASSSIRNVKGFNAQLARHSGTVDSAYNNIVHEDYHRGRRTGDRELADIAHKRLQGINGPIMTTHPFKAIGGALSDERMLSHSAHSGHMVGTMIGAGLPPMSPHHDVLDIRDGRTQPTLRNHDEHFTSLRQPPTELTHGDLDAEVEALEEQYSLDKGKAVTDEQHDLLDKEYERRLERLKEEYEQRPHVPTMQDFGYRTIMGTAGLVDPILSRQPPVPATEEYERALDELSSLEERLAVREEIDDKDGVKEYESLIAEKNQQLDDLESQLEPRKTGNKNRGQRFSPDGHDSVLQARLVADTTAISQAGSHIKSMLESDPEIYNHIFNPNLDHETVEANMRMFAMMANDYLNIVPHDQHGIRTKGHHRITKEGLTGQVDIGTQLKNQFAGHDVTMNASSLGDANALMQQLGLDPENEYHNATLMDYIENTFLPNFQQNPSYSAPVMTMRQYIEKLHPDLDIEKEHESLKKDKRTRNVDFLRLVNELYNSIGHRADERNTQIGIHHHLAFNSDPRIYQRNKKKNNPKLHSSGGNPTEKRENDYWNVMQKLDSILSDDPSVSPPDTVTETSDEVTDVPVDQFGPNAHSVHSLYNSSGLRHEFGDEFHPNFKYKVSRNGKLEIIPVPEGHPQRMIQPLGKFWNAVAPPEWLNMLRHPDHQVIREGLNREDRMGPQFKQTRRGVSRNNDPHTFTMSADVGLADLTNPDIIRKDLGSKVPLLQPMHRIFELDDLEGLRGFTGDWIVSHMPEGERGFVKKEDDEVSSDSFNLSDEDKENFKKVTDEDFNADVIKTEEGYYIFDVIEFDDKEVHSVLLNDRIKILRGGMEGVENIHVPSASDTRLTDDEGLKTIVEELSKNHDSLLLRDAKSVYMVGELRHPKWVLMKPGNDVVLRVLERRGSNPYTYRLGTGPITREEEIGDRGVESDGETYMDVGVAFNSPEKFNEGDHVRVNVASVSKVETTNGDDIYTLTGSKIEGEAEGEGLVSRETLGMLAKSGDTQWLCEIHRAKSGIRIAMPQGDVLYKCTQTGSMWTVHSPLANNDYLIRLAESQRNYWSPVAGALLKAGLEIAEKEEIHETEGEAEPLIEPHKEEDTDWWEKKERQKVLVKGLTLIDRFLKSGAGSVGGSGSGTQGLGIGYATPIESPSGPTNLHDEKTMPDFDNRKRPGEDSYIEPETEDSEPAKHITIPTEEGTLEVTSDKAVFRT